MHILNKIIEKTTSGVTEIHTESQKLDNLKKALMQIFKGIKISKYD